MTKSCDGLPGTCTEYPACQCGRAWKAAEADRRAYGTGYVRVTTDGVTHIPAEQVYFKNPPTGD